MCICIDPSELRKFSELKLDVTCVIGAPTSVGALPDAQIRFFLRLAAAHFWASEFSTFSTLEGVGILGREGFWVPARELDSAASPDENLGGGDKSGEEHYSL
jgi:hypothetical protein